MTFGAGLAAVNIGAGFAWAQFGLLGLFYLAIFLLCCWALGDCAIRPARAFPAAGKRTRPFWLAVTGVALVVAFLGFPFGPAPSFFQFVALGSAVAAIVYLVDVRPAVAPYSRRRGGGGGSSSRGGW